MSDRLGFGRAIYMGRYDFGVTAQLDALRETICDLGGAGPMVVARHSLGGALAGGHRYPLVHPDDAVADLIAMAAAASTR